MLLSLLLLFLLLLGNVQIVKSLATFPGQVISLNTVFIKSKMLLDGGKLIFGIALSKLSRLVSRILVLIKISSILHPINIQLILYHLLPILN